jgi:hypothetical protein
MRRRERKKDEVERGKGNMWRGREGKSGRCGVRGEDVE